MARGERLRPDEWEYIRANCITKSDEKLAAALGRNVRTIVKARRKLGINKKIGGILENIDLGKTAIEQGATKATIELSEDQRKQFYKTEFANSLYYKNLKEQFTKEELDFYLEEWGSLCLQFEDIVATEKRQIDEYIKLSIMDNRILRNIFLVEQEIEKLQEEIEQFRAEHPSLEDDEVAQERDSQLMNLVMSMNGQCKSMTLDHQKNLEMKTKLLGELNARRKDRVDQLSKRGTTFLGIVQEFRDREVRKSQGRHMELVRMAKEKKKSEWRRPITFPDGTKDVILLDENSTLPTPDIVLLQDKSCQTVSEFCEKPDSKILVVDNDHRRNQFFGDVFNNSKLEFASNAEKAIEKLDTGEYDLVCLDYDLGLDTKGTKIAEHIVRNNLCPKTKILVHSMNRRGAYEIKNYLVHSHNIEIYPFEDIVKNLGAKNATNSIGSGENEGDTPHDSKE